MSHSDAHAAPPADPTPAEAGLRLVAHRLNAAAVHLYDGAVLVAAVGRETPALCAVAATLGDALTLFDVSAVADGPRYAAGQRAGEAALLVLGVDPDALDAPWQDAFAEALALAAGLVPAAPVDAVHGRLLHRVATHPGSLDERLALALAGFAEALALDAAAFARVDDGVWTPEATHDPQGLLPTDPTPVTALPCAMTAYADGPVAVEDADGGAYLGAPVFAGGRTIGTLMAAGRAPRAAPFSPADRDLAEALARWVGSAVGGRDAARRIADREAALAAFVDRAPVAMALTTLAPDGGVRFVSVNAAAARLLGHDAEALAGLSPEDAGVDERTARVWAAGTRRALEREAGASLPPITIALGTPDGPRTLAATLTRLDVHGDAGQATPCVSFVAEDVTDREAGLRVAAERRRLAEAAAEEQAALFERLHRDVRTPLTTILGYADLLGPDMPAGEPEAIREVIERSAQQLLATLDATVALAEAARVSIALVPVDAAAVVREAVEAAAPAAREAGIEIQFVAAVARTPLLMDPALVGRVVQALVAEGAAVPGARHVDARLSDDGSHLVFDVGVRAATASPAGPAAPRPAFLDHVVGRLVERLGGVVDESGQAMPWRRTVRLPRHAAVVVELPPEALSAEALVFEQPADAPTPLGLLTGPLDGGSPFGATLLDGQAAGAGA